MKAAAGHTSSEFHGFFVSGKKGHIAVSRWLGEPTLCHRSDSFGQKSLEDFGITRRIYEEACMSSPCDVAFQKQGSIRIQLEAISAIDERRCYEIR